MIAVEHLTVRFPAFCLQSIDLAVASGEFFILIGPTGAGKTVVLESILGITSPSAGRIVIDGRDVTRLPPERRGVGIVYQDQALFPHLNVRKNITYGLRYHPGPFRGEGVADLNFLVDRLGLKHLLDRSVVGLSGGERQRVALARALVVNPSILLLDEPLSALDPNFREEIREVLKQLHRDTGTTILMVTHDFEEAHFLAQRVAVIHNGTIAQTGPLPDVFFRPRTPFVAQFVGMRNLFRAALGGDRAQVASLDLSLGRTVNGRQGHVAVRPENVRIRPPEADTDGGGINRFRASVSKIVHMGFHCQVAIDTNSVRLEAHVTTSTVLGMGLAEGDQVTVCIEPEHIHIIEDRV